MKTIGALARTSYPKPLTRRLRIVCAAWPLLLLLALPIVVQAQYVYTTTNGTITFRGYTGSSGVLNIPGTINGLPVTSIGAYACYNQSSLTSVTIPNSVTSIEDSAFARCVGLTSVAIPNTVTNIGVVAFSGCASLTSVNIPNSVTRIGDLAFSYCTSLTAITVDALNSSFSSVDGVLFDKSQTTLIRYPGGKTGNYAIPENVTSIAAFAFSSCTNLPSVTIPDSVTLIAELAFPYCINLTAITVDALNSSFSSVDGVLFDKNQTRLIKYPDGKAGDFVIPNGVTRIGDSALSYCANLTSVTIPNSVIRIGNSAFGYCTSLTNVTIGNGVISIGALALANCARLTAITVDALSSAFRTVDGVLFDKSQTTLIQYPGGKSGSYIIPNSVTNIGNGSFAGCLRLTSVTIPNSVFSIEGGAFDYCTNLTNVMIGNGVTRIGDAAFYYCTRLTNVAIPNSVTTIRDSAFYSCTNLTGVSFKGDAPSAEYTVFPNANQAIVYYLPGTTGWGPAFGGRPAVLWNPRVQSGDPSFGVQANQFGFTITGTTGLVLVVEACTNLVNPAWSALETNTLIGGSSYFSDPQWTNYPNRLYRLRSP